MGTPLVHASPRGLSFTTSAMMASPTLFDLLFNFSSLVLSPRLAQLRAFWSPPYLILCRMLSSRAARFAVRYAARRALKRSSLFFVATVSTSYRILCDSSRSLRTFAAVITRQREPVVRGGTRNLPFG